MAKCHFHHCCLPPLTAFKSGLHPIFVFSGLAPGVQIPLPNPLLVIPETSNGTIRGFAFDLIMICTSFAPQGPFPCLIRKVEFAAFAGCVANGGSDIVWLGLVLHSTLSVPPATAFDFVADELLLAWSEFCDAAAYGELKTLGHLDDCKNADAEFTSQLEHAQALLHDRPSKG